MKIEGIVLAAGFSRRAGAFKPELDLGGKTIIQHCIEGLLECSSRIIVVGGYRIERIRALVMDYPQVEVVFNPNYAAGMFTSVKEGIKHLSGERFFLTPGDYPLISEAVCRRLLAVEGKIVIPAYGGRRGHPVLLNSELISALLEEADSSNLRDFIHKRGFQVLEVDDPGILMDVDTPEDYQRIVTKIFKGGGVHER